MKTAAAALVDTLDMDRKHKGMPMLVGLYTNFTQLLY